MPPLIPRKVLRVYKVQLSILLFLVLFTGFHFAKPGISYLQNGGFRPFGIGYKHKTVIPIWVVAIILAILSYTFILYLLSTT